ARGERWRRRCRRGRPSRRFLLHRGSAWPTDRPNELGGLVGDRGRSPRQIWLDRHAAARGAARLEGLVLDDAVDQREDGEVAPEADVLARVDDGALLTHEDVPGDDVLAAEHLDPTHLGAGVTAVA